MPRTQEQNQVIKDKRRSKLLATALKVFAAEGYDAVTIDAVTKASKCSHGLFYHYFPGKPDVFQALLSETIMPSGVLPPLKKALEARGVRGLAILRDYLNEISQAPIGEVYIAKISCFLIEEESLPKEFERFAKENNLRGVFESLIRQGQDEGEVIAGDPKEISLAVNDLLQAAFKRKLEAGAKAKLVSADVLFGMLLRRAIRE